MTAVPVAHPERYSRAIEFLGIAATNDGSETTPRSGPSFDRDYTVRLGRAHGELAEHSPDEVTAGAIGYRWGYARPARFGADYARRYGLPPEQTLRGPAYA